MDLSTFPLEALLPFIAIGFAAQLVDGALGMAFGVISNTLLVSLGVPPAAASAGVHAAESFTTAASGISHIAHRNVNWQLFW
ncbi:UNVERIFIED_CONTAM: sulfite exporter TauE/SafE family protein, partial [Bacteroidetes bacterium 56_B9]